MSDKVMNYQEALDEEKITCDCDSCVRYAMHEAIRNRQNLEDVSFANNYINKFKHFSLVVDNLQTLCLFSGNQLEESFYGYNKEAAPFPYGKVFYNNLVEIYDEFDDNPKKPAPELQDVKNFCNYALDDDKEKFWIKSSMFRTCLTKKTAAFFHEAIEMRHTGLLDLVDKITSEDDLSLSDVLDALPSSPEITLMELITESMMRMWFRKEKYGSIKASESEYIAKLAWTFRRIPDWSRVEDNILVIDPIGTNIQSV